MLSNTWNKSVLKIDEKGQSRDKSKNYEIIFLQCVKEAGVCRNPHTLLSSKMQLNLASDHKKQLNE